MMNRRTFTTISLAAAAGISLSPSLGAKPRKTYIRLGGPIFDRPEDPDEWVKSLRAESYRAAYCPLPTDASAQQIRAYEQAARAADIVIAEVGAWSNPISPDAGMRREAFQKCIASLQLAEAIGANCCVNISGSKNPEHWAGPHQDNLTQDTFEEIVEVTRKIIDEVQPVRTYFALEPMPWTYPDSADAYLRLIKAIDRKQFGVHMDPMNLIVSPQLYYNNGAMIRDCFKKLGPQIRSCHAKDIILKEDAYTPQLSECQPGLGHMDYAVFLKELSKLKDIPLMMEHLQTAEEYRQAGKYIRSVGKQQGIAV